MPYHQYVFDNEKRIFVGNFEEMYQKEDVDIYDSWHQSELTDIGRSLSLMILDQYNFNSVLDIGCGKGAFTQLLKKRNNRVYGVDLSPTAIKKAQANYRDIEFKCMSINESLEIDDSWDLVVLMEMLSYIENWKEVLTKAALKTEYLYISLYLPHNPIGYIKNIVTLKEEVLRNFDILHEFVWNADAHYLICRKKS